MDKTDKTDKIDESKRFYWSDPPLGNVIETNKVGYVLEFYDHPGWDGNVGKIQISDVTSGFNNHVFTFFKEHIIDGTEIAVGSHVFAQKTDGPTEKTWVLLDPTVSKAGIHPTLNTIHWALNIRKQK